jgi:alkaline phosphatase
MDNELHYTQTLLTSNSALSCHRATCNRMQRYIPLSCLRFKVKGVFELLSDALQLATLLIHHLDYLGVALLMVVVAPELILPFSGFLVARGDMHYVGVLLAGTAGAIVGQLLIYSVARAFGEARVRRFLRRYGGWLLLKESDLDKVFSFLNRFELSAMITARFIPTARSMISLPAGFLPMPLWRFALLTAIGTGLWNSLLIGLGALLGRNWQALAPVIDAYEWLGVAVLVLIVAMLIRRRVKQQLALRTSDG